MSLLALLSTSSFFLSTYLSDEISSGDHNAAQLNFALKRENKAALTFALKQLEKHSEPWLLLAKKLAKTNAEVAIQLAHYFIGKQKHQQTIVWYQQAIRLNSLVAAVELAQFYFNNQEDVITAKQVLIELFEHSITQTSTPLKVLVEATILNITIAIHQGDISLVEEMVKRHSQLLKNDSKGLQLLNNIDKFSISTTINTRLENTHPKLNLNKENSYYQKPDQPCPISLQLFATNLIHLKQVEQLINRFKSSSLSKNTPSLSDHLCFSPVRYIALNALSCTHTKDEAIRCDESILGDLAQSIRSRYVGIMLPKGGANVHLGLLYFDAQDDVNVFSHEVSHLLGFIDEYPLPSEHSRCENSQLQPFSHNIAVLAKFYQGARSLIRAEVLAQISWAAQIKASTPILQAVTLNNKQGWLLETPEKFESEVGVFAAKSCDNNFKEKLGKNSISAFKPVANRTQLTYFSLPFPNEYLTLLNTKPNEFLMPSFHYNIAFAHYRKGNIVQANYWLTQAEKWENTKERRIKIRQGNF